MASRSAFVPLFEIGGDPDAVNHESVRTKVRNFVRDVEIQPIENGHHGDQGGDSQHHTQESEEGAQLMGAQSIQRDPESFLQRDQCLPRAGARWGCGHYCQFYTFEMQRARLAISARQL
jgi:hypothetical protein